MKINLSYDSLNKEELSNYIQKFARIKENSSYVYALFCNYRDPKEVVDSLESLPSYDLIPDYVWACYHSGNTPVYVGSTNDIVERLDEHMWAGTFREIENEEVYLWGFTFWFPPKRIYDIKRFDTREKAYLEEERLAKKLRKRNGDWFVFSH